VQADGKIVVAGKVYGGVATGDQFMAFRLNSNGDLDADFGIAGIQIIDLTSSNDGAYGVMMQPDGKILLAGYAGFNPSAQIAQMDFAAVRLNSDGSLDASFDSDGKQTIDFGSTDDQCLGGIALQADGKIVLAGHSAQGSATGIDFAVTRLNSNGSLDVSFDGDGKQTIDFGGNEGVFAGVALQADGKIVIASNSTIGFSGSTGNDFAVVRLNVNGSLDETFGSGGKKTFDFDSSVPLDYTALDYASGIAIQPDGKIVIVGYTERYVISEEQTIDSDFAMARLNVDGSLDSTFHGDGKQTIDFGLNAVAHGIALQPDGKIVLAGFGGRNFGLARVDGYELSIVGTQGVDTFTISAGTLPGTLKVNVNGAVTDNVSASGEVFVAGLGGDDTFLVTTALPGGLILAGQGGSDTYDITFGNLAGTVHAGDDGASGTDLLIVRGTPGDDDIFKDAGKVTLGNPVQQTVLSSGIETRQIRGGGGDDLITDPGSDTFLFGDEGNDTIVINATFGTGVTADGGAGSDSYVIEAGSLEGPIAIADSGTTGADSLSLIGTPAADTLVQTDTGFIFNGTQISFDAGLETATVDGGGGSDQQVIEGTPPVPEVQIVTPFNYVPVFTSADNFSVAEGTTFVGVVTATDADLPAQTLSFNIAGGVDGGAFQITSAGVLSFLAAPDFDLPTDANGDNVYLVDVRVDDGAGGLRVQSIAVTVTAARNAPVAGIAGPADGVRGQARSFTLFAQDADALDAAAGFEYRINWGDGSPVQIVQHTPGNGAGVTIEHTFVAADSYCVSVVAVDIGGLISDTALHSIDIVIWQLQADPLAPGKHVLVVGGSTADDRIHINPYHNTDDYVRVKINEVDYDVRRRQALGPNVDRIEVYAQAGDDRAEVAGGVDVPVMIDGGAGHDRLKGGSTDTVFLGGDGNDLLVGGSARNRLEGGIGNDELKGHGGDDLLIGGDGDDLMVGGSGQDVLIGGIGHDELRGGGGNDILLGGDGNDVIAGDEGRDFLIGGNGADELIGNGDDDILVAGSTVHDNDLAALDLIMAEWSSGRSYQNRISNLLGTGSPTRANGSVFLNGQTVCDDGDRDVLTGNAGLDWFLFNADGDGFEPDRDVASDLRSNELLLDIDIWS
jgi:uncharacterized delta-60 repeat protein